MLLYHYSKERYDQLRTRENLGQPKASPTIHDKYLPGRYDQHISFFFDPIPYTLMSKFYGNDHASWFSGSVLNQYVVDSSAIGDFKYHIVETPENTALVLDDDITLEDYLTLYPEMARSKGYLGQGNKSLEKAAKPFVGKLRENISRASKLPDWHKIKNKYAANVPHLMLYPATGVISFEEVDTIKIR